MGKRTEEDFKAMEQRKTLNLKKRKMVIKLHRKVAKTVEKEEYVRRPRWYSRKTAQKAIGTQRRLGVLTARASGYPKEFTLQSHNVFLNPMKKLLRGEAYANPEYQAVLIGIVRDFFMKQSMEAKAQEAKAQEIKPEAPNAQ